MDAVLPLFEGIEGLGPWVRKIDSRVAAQCRELKNTQKVLQAIANPDRPTGQFVMRPREWDTPLVPRDPAEEYPRERFN
jgi:hypothetical protein